MGEAAARGGRSPDMDDRENAAIATGLVIVIIQILLIIGLGYELHEHLPSNHIGCDPRMLLAVSGLGVAWTLIAWHRGPAPRALGLTVLATTLLLTVGVLVIDRCDLLVDYDVWLNRGMPDARCFG